MSDQTVSRIAHFDWNVTPFKRTKPNVAIVGFTAHRDMALELDPETWELWGLNELHRYMPAERFDRWFEIHPRAQLERDPGGPEHLADLAKFQVPVYMHRHWPDIPPSLPFPADQIVANLGYDYFTNCPAWMIGMAIAFGFERIHMYGVDMATDTEYATQRPCCEWWLGVARGRGIDVAVPPTSDLLKCVGRYGYESGDLYIGKLHDRLGWLHGKDNDLLGAMRKLDAEYRAKHNNLLGILERARGAAAEVSLGRQTAKAKERVRVLADEIGQCESALRSLNDQYEGTMRKMADERNQVIGSIQDCNFWLRSWGIAAAAPSTAVALPDRTQDPRTGITAAYTPRAASVDSPDPVEVQT